MEALCSLAAHDPNTALELLDGTIEAAMPPELIMASAYQMTGRLEDAKAVLQVGIIRISSFCSIFSRLTSCCVRMIIPNLKSVSTRVCCGGSV